MDPSIELGLNLIGMRGVPCIEMSRIPGPEARLPVDPAILDLAFLRRQVAGDAALEADLLRLLVGQCVHLLPILNREEDCERRRDAAHGLLGAAANVGALRLAEAAAALEGGRVPRIPIDEAVREVVDAIQRNLADEGLAPLPLAMTGRLA